MGTLHPALIACASAGITLTLGDDDATFFAEPKTALTAELRTLLREHKPAILAYLRTHTWDGHQALALTKQLAAEIRAWQSVCDLDGLEASHLIVGVLAAALLARDMAALYEAVALLDEAKTWWRDMVFPEAVRA